MEIKSVFWLLLAIYLGLLPAKASVTFSSTSVGSMTLSTDEDSIFVAGLISQPISQLTVSQISSGLDREFQVSLPTDLASYTLVGDRGGDDLVVHWFRRQEASSFTLQGGWVIGSAGNEGSLFEIYSSGPSVFLIGMTQGNGSYGITPYSSNGNTSWVAILSTISNATDIFYLSGQSVSAGIAPTSGKVWILSRLSNNNFAVNEIGSDGSVVVINRPLLTSSDIITQADLILGSNIVTVLFLNNQTTLTVHGYSVASGVRLYSGNISSVLSFSTSVFGNTITLMTIHPVTALTAYSQGSSSGTLYSTSTQRVFLSRWNATDGRLIHMTRFPFITRSFAFINSTGTYIAGSESNGFTLYTASRTNPSSFNMATLSSMGVNNIASFMCAFTKPLCAAVTLNSVIVLTTDTIIAASTTRSLVPEPTLNLNLTLDDIYGANSTRSRSRAALRDDDQTSNRGFLGLPAAFTMPLTLSLVAIFFLIVIVGLFFLRRWFLRNKPLVLNLTNRSQSRPNGTTTYMAWEKTESKYDVATAMTSITQHTVVSNQREMAIPGFLSVQEEVDYHIEKQLGDGGFATVYSGTLLSKDILDRCGCENKCAIKVMKVIKDASPEMVKEDEAAFVQEVSLMWFFNKNPFFVQILGYNDRMDKRTIVMRLYELGTVDDVIMGRSKEVPWSLELMMGMIHDILSGVGYMHAAGMVHNDIKPGNVLIDQTSGDRRPHAVLSDFGITQIVTTKSLLVSAFQVSKLQGASILYSAPELLKRYQAAMFQQPIPADELQSNERLKVDVYAVAILGFEMLSRKNAWGTRQEQEVMEMALQGLRPEWPPAIQVIRCKDRKLGLVCDMIERSWEQNVFKRPSVHTLIDALACLKQ